VVNKVSNIIVSLSLLEIHNKHETDIANPRRNPEVSHTAPPVSIKIDLDYAANRFETVGRFPKC
jgi:hypothetical protein